MTDTSLEAFVLRVPKHSRVHSGIVRISGSHHHKLASLSEDTGLPVGRIVEQCIDFALSHRIVTEED